MSQLNGDLPKVLLPVLPGTVPSQATSITALPGGHRICVGFEAIAARPRPELQNLPEAAAIGKNEYADKRPRCDALSRGVRPCSRSHTLRASSGAHRITEAAKEREGQ